MLNDMIRCDVTVYFKLQSKLQSTNNRSWLEKALFSKPNSQVHTDTLHLTASAHFHI